MNILAIDTTTKKANIGIKTNDIIKVNSIDNEVTHSEKLLPLVDETLKECNITVKDIECIACTTGPGSFTGIRIGLATAKALAKVIGAKIYAMDSLELLARSVNTQQAKAILCLIDAKNTRAYAKCYCAHDKLTQVLAAENKYINEILEDLDKVCTSQNILKSDVLIVADTTNVLELIPDEYKKSLSSLNIETLLELANSTEDTELTDYLKLNATYVRSSEAERTKYGE